MANELKHADIGQELTKPEWEDGVLTHEADGQTLNDMLYFNGTSWVRIPHTTIVQAAITAQAYLDMPEATEPGNPSADTLRLFTLDDNGFSVLSFKDANGMVRQFMRDSIFIGYNDTGSTIAANRIVYASGSTGTVPKIALAKADSAATMPAIGVTIDTTANGAYGRVMQVGLLEDVNTSALSAGDVLYVSATTAGVPTATKPTAPNLAQEIGTVLVDNASTGAIQIVARSSTEFGIGDNDVVQVDDASVADGEGVVWTANGIEGVNYGSLFVSCNTPNVAGEKVWAVITGTTPGDDTDDQTQINAAMDA
jgi:hypothetical protein